MKTAVVTGASYGIGESITDALLKEGWKIYGISRSEPKIKNENFVWLQCDLSDAEQIAKCMQAVEEDVVDALVSNAGVAEVENVMSVSSESYNHTFTVNVLAPMLVVKNLRDKIKSAAIISLSSVSDRFPEADFALYCSSKAANTIYFDSLAAELKEAKVFTLLPDYVTTPMQHNLSDNNENFDWSACIDANEVAKVTVDLINGKFSVESGANIIVVNEKLKDDLKSVEKLYGFNTDTGSMVRI